MKKFIAVLVVCMMLAGIMPMAALADEAQTPADVFALLGDVVFVNKYSPDMTLKVAEVEGRSALVFESSELGTLNYFGDDTNLTFDEEYNRYTLEAEDGWSCVEFALKGDRVYALNANGIMDEDWNFFDGYYIDTTVEPDGSDYYPWSVGATENDEVYAKFVGGSLMVYGEGAMMDFEHPADRPWNDVAGFVQEVYISGDVSYIGKNAFNNCGSELEGEMAYVWLSIFSDAPLTIGESAFEGVDFGVESGIDLEENVVSIGSRAFANCIFEGCMFRGESCSIADDAFAGVTAKIAVPNTDGWNETTMVGYGGELTWTYFYRIILHVYDEEGDASLTYTYFFYDGEEIDIDLTEELLDYDIIDIERIFGNCDLYDPATNHITGVITENIVMNVNVVEKESDYDDDDPIPVIDPEPIDDPAPISPPGGSDEKTDNQISSKGTTPQTDDDTYMLLCICLAFGAALVFGLSFIPTAKKEN